MKKKNIEISRPLTGVEEWKEIKESILSGWLTQGPKVRKFEEMFSQYHRAKYSLATTSCTTALHLALLANNIGKGDEVIVPAFTWVSTANVVLYCGAKLVLADVDKKTFNICISDVLSKITSKTKAVIPVHLFGLCVDIDKSKILNLKKKKLPFKEKNLKNLFNKNFKNLFFENNIIRDKKNSTFIICVPTPLKNKKAELKYLHTEMEN